MIKCDLIQCVEIKGSPVQIAAEFENLARHVREVLCNVLGQEAGTDIFEDCIEGAKMKEEDRSRKLEEFFSAEKSNNPKKARAVDEIAIKLLERMFEEKCR